MIIGCSLLGSIQPFLWGYNAETEQCSLRPHAEALWEYWSWTTEPIVFLIVPLVILIVNVLVMREVWRMSNSGPAAAAAAAVSSRPHAAAERRHSSHGSAAGTPKSAATNAMLLTVSFYVIFTTLPATVVYVLGNAFPEVRPAYACVDDVITTTHVTPTGDAGAPQENADMAAWRRFVIYYTVSKIVNEICLSHYACNFFFYFVTGREFRLALRRLCRCCRCCGAVTEISQPGTEVTELSRCHDVTEISQRGSENGAPRHAQRRSNQARAARNEQRTLLANI